MITFITFTSGQRWSFHNGSEVHFIISIEIVVPRSVTADAKVQIPSILIRLLTHFSRLELHEKWMILLDLY